MGVGVGVCAINIRYRVYIHDVYLNIYAVLYIELKYLTY